MHWEKQPLPSGWMVAVVVMSLPYQLQMVVLASLALMNFWKNSKADKRDLTTKEMWNDLLLF